MGSICYLQITWDVGIYFVRMKKLQKPLNKLNFLHD